MDVGAALRPWIATPEDPVTEAVFDQHLANTSQAAEACMKLGAVILKPKGNPTVGFGQSHPPQPGGRES